MVATGHPLFSEAGLSKPRAGHPRRGDGAAEDLIPSDPRIRYKRLRGTRTLGAKRNLCVAESRGDLILHWDDDDWFAPHRISYQVEACCAPERRSAACRGCCFTICRRSGRGSTRFRPTSAAGWPADRCSTPGTSGAGARSPMYRSADTSFVWSQSLDEAVALEDQKSMSR